MLAELYMEQGEFESTFLLVQRAGETMLAKDQAMPMDLTVKAGRYKEQGLGGRFLQHIVIVVIITGSPPSGIFVTIT